MYEHAIYSIYSFQSLPINQSHIPRGRFNTNTKRYKEVNIVRNFTTNGYLNRLNNIWSFEPDYKVCYLLDMKLSKALKQ